MVQVTRCVRAFLHQVERGLDASCYGKQCRLESLVDRRGAQRLSGLNRNGRDVVFACKGTPSDRLSQHHHERVR